jgi:hypothetical protein
MSNTGGIAIPDLKLYARAIIKKHHGTGTKTNTMPKEQNRKSRNEIPQLQPFHL